jgi:uncharacterized membrane protein YfcA
VQVLTGVVIAAAGAAAGVINAIVGSGSLITFPVLLAVGYPPLTANISNNIGLVPGGVSGTWGYRRELSGQSGVLRRLAPMSVVGSLAGALLLLWLPASAFEAIVPVLIAIALVLVVLQPRIAAWAAGRREEGHRGHVGPVAMVAVLIAGMYGGYFGAAQGVLLIGLLGSLLIENLQVVNAIKNLLTLLVNAVAAVTFIVVAPEQVDWAVVVLIAAGSLTGGLAGAWVGRRLRPTVLRGVVVVIGLIALVRLLTT